MNQFDGKAIANWILINSLVSSNECEVSQNPTNLIKFCHEHVTQPWDYCQSFNRFNIIVFTIILTLYCMCRY